MAIRHTDFSNIIAIGCLEHVDFESYDFPMTLICSTTPTRMNAAYVLRVFRNGSDELYDVPKRCDNAYDKPPIPPTYDTIRQCTQKYEKVLTQELMCRDSSITR